MQRALGPESALLPWAHSPRGQRGETINKARYAAERNDTKTQQKGNRNELIAKKILIDDGWLVEQKNWSKWRGKDFFGLFDIVAIKGEFIKWIQIKSNRSDFYKVRKQIKNWLIENNLEMNTEIWLKENRQDWRVEKLYDESKQLDILPKSLKEWQEIHK